MATITLGQVKTRALQMTDYINSDFASDAELLQWANDGYLQFYDLIANTLEDFNLADPVTTTIASGNTDIDLSSAVTRFYLLKGLDFNYTGNKYHKVLSFNFSERNSYDNNFAETDPYYNKRRRYKLYGSKITIVPAETAPGTYKIWYVPEPVLLSDDSDTFENYNGWGDYVVQYVAKRIKIKSEEDFSPFEREMGFLANRIGEIAKNRDTNKIHSVTDVYKIGSMDDYY